MEYWDVYDRNRKYKGYKIMRGGDRRLGKDEYHLTCHVCIFSTDGRMLIQKRSDNKSLWGGLWDITAGGSVLAGEDVRTGASRELFEEIGVNVNFNAENPVMTFYNRNCISDYFFVVNDIDPASLELQSSEVSAVKYATKDEATELLREGAFVPYKESFLNLLFDLYERENRVLFERVKSEDFST